MLKGYPLIFTEGKEYHEALKREKGLRSKCCGAKTIRKKKDINWAGEDEFWWYECSNCHKPTEVEENKGGENATK